MQVSHLKAIVCVDDEPSILSALQQQIMRVFNNEYSIELAESGEEALEIIHDLHNANTEVSLIITDEMMPGIKGHALIEQILKQTSTIPCILLTGYAQSEIINQITSNHPILCVSKPWDAHALMELIKGIIKE